MGFVAHPTATVEEGAIVGEGTRIWHYAQVRKDARVGRDCVIGKSAFIDAHVVVGDRCKIQNFATLYHGLTVGDDVFIGPSATFTNDRVPRASNPDWVLGKTRVDDGASIGANATINCDLTIGKYAMVASGSVVTKSVPPHALVMGNPARIRGFVCICGQKVRDPAEKGDVVVLTCSACRRVVEIPRELARAHRAALE